MDRILIIITLVLSLFFWIIKNRDNLTYSKISEILIAFFIFSCCFPRLFLPLYSFSFPQGYGTFGQAFRFQIYFLLVPFFILILANKFKWRILKINKSVWIPIFLYVIYCLLNPFNSIVSVTIVSISYVLIYLIFLYVIVSTCTIKEIINGIYMGFSLAIVLNLFLSILFPVLGIIESTRIFTSDASIRNIDRAGAVGTFGHPNILGVVGSYIFMFFFSCVLVNFKKRSSMIFTFCAFLITLLSGSRSALLAILVGVILIVTLYIYRKYNIINPKIILKGLVPVVLISIILLYFTPISKLFFNSDMDDMMLARLIHYYCGYEIISEHPFLGVGLNSHLKYLNDNIDIDFDLIFGKNEWLGDDFMYSNPIHNIWVILLCELGILGFGPIIFYISKFFYLFKKRIKNSVSDYYKIALITALGIFGCLFVQGNSDWAPLTPTGLNISILFIFLGCCSFFGKEDDEITNEKILS